jgi:hypothetical protein
LAERGLEEQLPEAGLSLLERLDDGRGEVDGVEPHAQQLVLVACVREQERD